MQSNYFSVAFATFVFRPYVVLDAIMRVIVHTLEPSQNELIKCDTFKLHIRLQ